MAELNITKNVPVVGEYDVVVCGGGPAGWVAAVSAARAGLSVALVERYGFLGGTATSGIVIPISGFHFKGKRVVGGIAWEFVERLMDQGAALPEMPEGHVSANNEYCKLMAARMVQESGTALYTNCYISGCMTDGGKLTHVVFESKNGTEAIGGKVFIDATGDGDLCHMAGVPMLRQEHPMQPVSLGFIIAGVDNDCELMRLCVHHNGNGSESSCNEEIRDFLLKKGESEYIPQFGGPWFNSMLKGQSLAVNMTRADVDATDRAAFTEAEFRLREELFRLVEEMREAFPEFRDVEIVSTGVNAGIRETRHIKGVHTMSLRDVEEGTRFPCPVAHCAHPMDIHASKGAGQSLTWLQNDCFVPHSAMVADGFQNLIAAGRCISAEREPYSSLRVQATCMSMGEATGLMAKLHIQSGEPTYALPEDKLRAMIDERGFVL